MTHCTYCKRKSVVESFKPFCSKRCADLDLWQWLGGGYAIPTEEPGPVAAHDPDESDPYMPAND